MIDSATPTLVSRKGGARHLLSTAVIRQNLDPAHPDAVLSFKSLLDS